MNQVLHTGRNQKNRPAKQTWRRFIDMKDINSSCFGIKAETRKRGNDKERLKYTETIQKTQWTQRRTAALCNNVMKSLRHLRHAIIE